MTARGERDPAGSAPPRFSRPSRWASDWVTAVEL